MEMFNISLHCQQRYAERIMDKNTTYDVNRFIVEHEEKIKTDINKMIEFGNIIYTGRQSQKTGKGNVVDVYLKDLWVILVDKKDKKVITLYKIDLGLDDDFNKAYVSKMIDKLNQSKENLEAAQRQVQEESDMYKKMIEESESQIREYKSMINNLEELCSGYQTIIDNNQVKVTQVKMEVTDIMNTLIGKKEF